MNARVSKIVSEIPQVNVFADIGCDHGYASLYMLKSKKCNKVIFSDISEKCLLKAQTLLSDYIVKGVAEGIVSDGFSRLPEVDLALIAGMGGEEIVKIFSNAEKLPKGFVIQPMKNPEKVREYLVNNGYKIVKDYTFKSQRKYYDLIRAERGEDEYSLEELEFGRDNLRLKPKDFIEMIEKEISKLLSYAKRKMSEEKRAEILSKAERLKSICL